MKSYVQGLITGAVFVFALMVLMGAAGSRNQVGTYEAVIGEHIGGMGMLNTKTGVFTGVVKKEKIAVRWDLENHTIQNVKMKNLEDK